MVEKNNPGTPPKSPPPAATEPVAGAADADQEETKQKRKYTRVFKPAQVMERRMNKAQRRMAKAIVAGLEEWNKQRNKSSRKSKDGAMRDGMKNAAKACGKTIRVASRIPEDMLRSMPIKPWKMSKNLRVFFPPAWFMR